MSGVSPAWNEPTPPKPDHRRRKVDLRRCSAEIDLPPRNQSPGAPPRYVVQTCSESTAVLGYGRAFTVSQTD